MGVDPVKEFKTPIAEGASAKYRATLRDEDGVPITSSAITRFTLTLDDPDTGTFINGRNDLTIFSNGGTVSSEGVFEMRLSSADTIAIGTERLQRRRMTYHVEFEGGGVLNRKIVWWVRALTHIATETP